MILKEEETIDLIIMLLTKHAPDSLDRRDVLENLERFGSGLFKIPAGKCSICREELLCPDCGDFDVSSEITVRIGNRTIYSN